MITIGQYPARRMRRNRDGAAIRAMLSETSLSPANLIWPIFIVDGVNQRVPIASMPGIYRHSIDQLPALAQQAASLSINAIALFPYIDPALKTRDCREAFNPDNLVCKAVRHLRNHAPDLMIICDVALDPFNLDGHDGLYRPPSGARLAGQILNDETLPLLQQQALVQAKAGADCLAPSDMMDGRIGAIRQALDDHGFQSVRLISYAAKYASAFYGPFREAVGSGDLLVGDKKSYQLNPANHQEALHEVALDLAEGADMVMVKPGMPYLDIIRQVKDEFKVPVFAYQVSGEYAMLKLAIDQGIMDDTVMLESLIAFRRAGASAILSYFAPPAA
ncbi:MAG: porphobilinogen synthase, partial [Alphaproteobacteria bacterium]